jgi:aspartate racemase
MTPRRVGILGGMGPQATVLLMQRLIAAVPAEDDADHIPLIVDQNPQVPSRIRFLIEGDGRRPRARAGRHGAPAGSGGAEALAMPCNTAHHFARRSARPLTLPFLDMVTLHGRRPGAGGGGGAGGHPRLARRAAGSGSSTAPLRRGLVPLYADGRGATAGRRSAPSRPTGRYAKARVPRCKPPRPISLARGARCR